MADRISQRPLGASGIAVSILGIGCWAFGGGDYWGAQSQEEVEQVVHAALDQGGNYFDTAEAYNSGASEVSLGKALRGRRGDAVIGTKISRDHLGSAEAVRAHCEASLRRLDTEYIDLYMVHWPVWEPNAGRVLTWDPWQESFLALEALVREGKVRALGVSNHGVQQMQVLRDYGVPIVANELPYSLLTRALEAEILPYCERHQLGILGYMPLMQGLLTGKFRAVDDVPSVRTRTRHFRSDRSPMTRHHLPGHEAAVFRIIEGLDQLARAEGVSPTTLAMSWSTARTPLTSTIVGVRGMRQLHELLDSQAYSMPESVREQLDQMTAGLADAMGPSPDYFEDPEQSRTW